MLESFWYVACESQELRRRPLSRVIFGKPFVLFRGNTGHPVALEDRCAHRNYPLSKGKVVNGTIQCGYHGWCYDGSGHVCNIPSITTLEETTKSISVPQYPCLEQDGYIWVVPCSRLNTEFPPRVPRLGEPYLQTFRLKTRFSGDVETCLENFLDCPHAAFVHKGLFRTHSPKVIEAQLRVRDDGAEVEYFGESRKGGMVWKLLSRKQTELKHIDRFILPSTSRVDYIFSDCRSYTITSHCTPVTETETDVYTTISFRLSTLGFFRTGFFIKPIFKFLSQRIIGQDVRAMRVQRENIKRFGGTQKFRVVQTDFLFPYIVQSRKALSAGKQPAFLNRTEEKENRVAVCI